MIQNNSTRCTTILHGAQQFFVMQDNFSRCTTIFRDSKQFHGAQQAFEIQNNFSRCTTSFRDAVDTYIEQNSVSRCKIKFHDAQQKFGRLVTSTGNFISCDHTASCSLPPCFVNIRATQLTMAASLLPTGDEKEIITYYFSRGYEYDAIVHFLANTTFKYQGTLWRILLDLVSLSHIIRLLHPSIQQWTGNPKGFNLSYPSTCHVWFGPGEEYRRLCNARDLLCSQPCGSNSLIRFSTTCLGT